MSYEKGNTKCIRKKVQYILRSEEKEVPQRKKNCRKQKKSGSSRESASDANVGYTPSTRKSRKREEMGNREGESERAFMIRQLQVFEVATKQG